MASPSKIIEGTLFHRLAAKAIIKCFDIIGLLPFKLRSRFGFYVGWLISPLLSRDRQVVELQMKNFLEESYSPKLVSKVFARMAQTAFECLNSNYVVSNHENCVYFPNVDELKSRLDKSGCLFLSAHIGNWELLAPYITKALKLKGSLVARTARSPIMHHILNNFRDKSGAEVVWKSKRAGAVQAMQYLKNGYCLGALIDQDTQVDSIMLPFFGHSAKTPSGIVNIAKRVDASIASVFVIRTATGKFECRCQFIDQTKSLEDILLTYHQHLEEVIREFPDQWVWFHKRWRTLKSGERLGSKEYLEYLETMNS